MTFEAIVIWCGFFGSWLLFLGPMQQAVLELREEDEARERLRDVHTKVPEPPHSSSWWWLFPPVKIYLENRIRNQYKGQIGAALDPEDMAILMTYFSKARAWMYVGLGGLLIAIEQTSELFEQQDWKNWYIFSVTVIFMIFLCLSNVVRTARAGHDHSGHEPKNKES